MDDAVHDGAGVNSGAEPLVPILVGVLGAEHGGGVSVAALEELEQHAAHPFIGRVEQPFIKHEQRESGVFLQERRDAVRFVPGQGPRLSQVRQAYVVSPDPVSAGLLGQGLGNHP